MARIVLVVVPVLSGCTQLLGRSCTSILVFGLDLHLEDATSDGPPTVTELTATATDGDFVDSVGAQGTVDYTLSLAAERPGVYTVQVRSDEYEPWERDGVVVREDSEGCHVEPVSLDVVLEPVGPAAR